MSDQRRNAGASLEPRAAFPRTNWGFAFSLARKLSALGDAENTLTFDLSGAG